METGRLVGGGIMLVMGLLFLLANYGILSPEMWKLWPLIFIVIGAAILVGTEKRGKSR